MRSKSISVLEPSGPAILTLAVASSGQSSAPSNLRSSWPSTTLAWMAPPEAVTGNVSFTTAAQKSGPPPQPAQGADHRSPPSLVHALTRPRPASHEASSGSSSGPIRSSTLAVGLAVVAM
jgi:hypothetical protein